MSINKSCGRMEEGASISTVLRQLADKYDAGKVVMAMEDLNESNWNQEGICVGFIPSSKHHNGKPMMKIANIADCPTICLEISEEGMFAYYVDDGVS